MAESAVEPGGELKGLDSESREMILDTVAQLRKRVLTKEKILELDKKEIFPEEIIREMLGPDLGLQLLFIPEEYGGMDGGARDCCALIHAISKICIGISTAFFAVQLGADPLLVGATKKQKEKWLGAITKGDSLVAYAVTEAGAGSNLAALKTRAEPLKDDSGKITSYKINGSKQFISTGGYADFITLLAKTPEGPSFFVVEKGTEGFEQGKGEEKHGIRASNTSPLTFNNVIVPVENLIGDIPGIGLKQANKVFGYTRLMVASMALGGGESALEIAIAYAKERIQFGSPLSEKQGYTHKLIVPNAVRLKAAAIHIEEVAKKFDMGLDDLEVEGSIAKFFTSESANRAADDAIQALGGYGYIAEFEVEKLKRDVKITCIYEGTSEIQQSIISIFRWKKTRKTKGGFYAGLYSEMKALHSEISDAGCDLFGLAANALNETITLVHENKLTKKQHVMFSLAEMISHVEVGISMARKVKELSAENDSETQKIKIMSRIFAGEVARLVAEKALEITLGCGVCNQSNVSEFMDRISHNKLVCGCHNIITDMDMAADILFER